MTMRSAFTLAELLVVVSITLLLAALAAPKALDLIRRSGLDRTVTAIRQTTQTAIRLARDHDPPASGLPYACFGVVLSQPPAGPGWMGVTWGVNVPPLPTDLLMRKQKRDYGDGAVRLWRTWQEYQDADDEVDAEGSPRPVLRLALPGNLQLHRPPLADPLASEPLNGSWGWIHQFGNGAIVNAASPGAMRVDVGVSPLLVVRDAGGQMAAALAIYAIGVDYANTLR